MALNKSVFDVPVENYDLLKLSYNAVLANNRQVGATTLKRGEVRGGGKKPWRQKGTGRARFGSSRNPIWRGGGVVFGPLGNENYTLKVSKTAKKVALRQGLSLANREKKIVQVEDFAIASAKTRDAVKFLEAQKIANFRRILLVAEKSAENIRATQNLANVNLVSPTYLNVKDILDADRIVFTKKSLAATTAWLENSAKGEK